MLQFIFDLDGTLQDTAGRSGFPLKNALKQVLDIDVARSEILPRMDGFNMGWIRESYEMTDEQHAEVMRLMHEGFASSPKDILDPLFEGTVEMLDALAAQGAGLHICSARAVDNIAERMEIYGIRDRLTHLFGKAHWDDPAAEKAVILREALKNTNLVAKDCVMVGDMAGDIRAGKENGMRTVGVTYGFTPYELLQESQADYYVHSLEELHRLLLQLLQEEQA